MRGHLSYRVAAALVAASVTTAFLPARAAPAAPAARDTNGFFFVQITDTHFGSRNQDAIGSNMVNAINALPMPIECVIHTGDIAADQLDNPRVLQTITSTLSRLRAPLHALPGNHDILPKRRDATLAAYRSAFGDLCSTVEYRGVLFVLLYTEPLRRKIAIEAYEPLKWLDQALSAAAGRPTIVFHHTPSVEDFYRNRMHPGWPADMRAAWTALLNRHQVKAVVAGHFHRDELHWLGDVPVYVCAPAATYWGRQPSFRIYEYRNGKLGYRTCYME